MLFRSSIVFIIIIIIIGIESKSINSIDEYNLDDDNRLNNDDATTIDNNNNVATSIDNNNNDATSIDNNDLLPFVINRLNMMKQQQSTVVVKRNHGGGGISKKCAIGDDDDDDTTSLQSAICNNVRKMLGRPQFVRFG